MKQTNNLGLALYEATDNFNITGSENSLNHNMELIDEKVAKTEYIATVNLNKIQLEYGSFSYDTGATVNSSTVLRTNDYIPVEPNTRYMIYSERGVLQDTSLVFQYDKNKTFVNYTSNKATGITTHGNCRYIKIRTQTSGTSGYELCSLNTRIMVEKGLSKSFAFDGIETNASEEFEIFLKGLKYPNLNTSTLEFGTFAWNNGVTNDADNIIRSKNFIPVEGSTLYQVYSERLVMKDTQYVFEYDKDEKFIRYQTINSTLYESGITTHPNCRYIKIRTQPFEQSEDASQMLGVRIMVEKGGTKTYFKKVVAENIVPSGKDTEITSRLNINLEAFVNAMVQKEFDLGFLAITDTHSLQNDLFKIMSYFAKNHIGDFVVHLGDIAGDTPTKEAKVLEHKNFIETARSGGGADVYVLRGNHENNHTDAHPLDVDYHLTDKDFFNQSIRNTNGVVKEYPYNYFYRDFDEYKIRVIFLDAGDIYDENGEMRTTGLNVMYQQRQIDWLKNKALNFADKEDKSEWSVVTMEHCLPFKLGHILNAFMNGTSYTGTYTFNYAEVPFEVNLSCDFTSQGAMEYIGHFCGHDHKDLIGDIDYISPVRPVVQIRNATINRVEFPNMEDFAMDFITINKADRTINAYRFGLGADRSVNY